MSVTPPAVRKVKFDNTARYVGKRSDRDWYEWKVFVDEDDDVLQKIEKVEYLLHRTFPNPLRRGTNRENHFALKSSGWGYFNILITVFFTDGSRLETSHLLDLAKAWDSSTSMDPPER
jgi:transcription initiation factor IIF auxiliary subunit